jgi:OmcA/MtrC family decaheme c-type cytochrome
MRIPSSVFAVGRYVVAFSVIAGSLALMSAPTKKLQFTKRDKAFYADPNVVAFVRPGLNIVITSTKIASDGTISVSYKLTDPKGLPLDRAGIQTPGAASVSFVLAYIPKGEKDFWSYTTRTQTSPITNKSAVQAGADSGGTTQDLAIGEYVYTFRTKAVSKSGGAFDPDATHRIVAYGSRNLTEFDLGTDRDSEWVDFLPSGGKVSATHDIIKNATCNKCHDDVAAHGGTRRGLEVCITCHTSQTMDPDTGNTVDMKVMVHKIHMGDELPSVKAGTPYEIVGNAQSRHDYSTVAMPSNAKRCEFCHEPKSGAAQADAYMKNPSRAACGSCHDNVNFATGAGHVNLPQVNDNQCAQCHIPQGELEYDASIKNAHIVATEAPSRPGVVVDIVKIENGGAGKAPLVTFSIKDSAGNGLSMAQMTGGFNRIGLVLAGPTSDYGYTSFGSDVTTKGYVSENPVPTAKCSPDGTCSYQFVHAVPANAKGTFAIGIEARRGHMILPGTAKQEETEYGAKNVVKYFSVDGSAVEPRRKVVDIAKCNSCHSTLALHGENRNQIEQCVLCHNPSETDAARRAVATVPADKALPAQAVNFALMIHKIHTGEKMAAEFKTNYTVVGFGGSHNDFSEVRYPAMTPSGGVADTAKCDMCHVNGSEAIFPQGKNNVTDPQGLLSPAPATTSACTACHQNQSAIAHAQANTDPKFGESCDVCHGTGKDFDVNKVHAGK